MAMSGDGTDNVNIPSGGLDIMAVDNIIKPCISIHESRFRQCDIDSFGKRERRCLYLLWVIDIVTLS